MGATISFSRIIGFSCGIARHQLVEKIVRYYRIFASGLFAVSTYGGRFRVLKPISRLRRALDGDAADVVGLEGVDGTGTKRGGL